MSERVLCGICKCVKDWNYYPFSKGTRSTIPTKTFHKGDIYNFEYHSDEALYYLCRNNENELCNWSFFDEMFEVIK